MKPLRKISEKYQYKAGVFLMDSKTVLHKDKVYVLVEGEDDGTILSKFFKPDMTEIRYCEGCLKVRKFHDKLKKQHFVYISILDRDFYGLEKLPITDSNMFYTDCHDMEMSILKHSSVFNNVNMKLGSSLKASFRVKIAEDLLLLSLLRYYNFKHKLNMTTDGSGLDLCSLTSENLNNMSLMITYFTPTVNSHKKTIPIVSFSRFYKKNKAHAKEQLENGHEFLKRWCYYIKSASGVQTTEDEIMDLMNSSYTISKFKNSNMGKRLLRWCDKNYSILV